MFTLKTEAKLTNSSLNREKAGEDDGRKAVVLNFECSAHAQWIVPLLKTDLTEKQFHGHWWKDKHRRCLGVGRVQLETEFKDCCDIEVGTLTQTHSSTGVTAKKFSFAPSEGEMYTLKFQLYVPNASHELLMWAYDNQLEWVDVRVEVKQRDLVDDKEDGGAEDDDDDEQEAA